MRYILLVCIYVPPENTTCSTPRGRGWMWTRLCGVWVSWDGDWTSLAPAARSTFSLPWVVSVVTHSLADSDFHGHRLEWENLCVTCRWHVYTGLCGWLVWRLPNAQIKFFLNFFVVLYICYGTQWTRALSLYYYTNWKSHNGYYAPCNSVSSS